MFPPGVFQIDQYYPTPDSTPGDVIIVQTQITGSTYHEQRGTCLIVNRTRFLPGNARIQNPSNATRTVTNVGAVSIRNPLQFKPGFQIAPLRTNTELKVEFQSGVASIWVAGEIISTKTLLGVARIQATTTKTQRGVSNIT